MEASSRCRWTSGTVASVGSLVAEKHHWCRRSSTVVPGSQAEERSWDRDVLRMGCLSLSSRSPRCCFPFLRCHRHHRHHRRLLYLCRNHRRHVHLHRRRRRRKSGPCGLHVISSVQYRSGRVRAVGTSRREGASICGYALNGAFRSERWIVISKNLSIEEELHRDSPY